MLISSFFVSQTQCFKVLSDSLVKLRCTNLLTFPQHIWALFEIQLGFRPTCLYRHCEFERGHKSIFVVSPNSTVSHWGRDFLEPTNTISFILTVWELGVMCYFMSTITVCVCVYVILSFVYVLFVYLCIIIMINVFTIRSRNGEKW